MILEDKKGNKIISVYWFVILFIVAGAVVYMALSFYGKPYDIRETEANALLNKVAKCLSEAGYLEKGVLGPEFKENFAEKCHLNFETEDAYEWKERGQYYVEINFYDFLTDQEISTIKEGNEDLKADCKLEGKTSPVCLKRSIYLIDKNQNQYKIDILSIVRKTEKNVQ